MEAPLRKAPSPLATSKRGRTGARFAYVVISMFFFLASDSVLAGLIGTYEISYLTNSVSQSRGWSSFAYPGSAPIFVGELSPGDYEFQIIEGRLTGNSVDPATFNDPVRGRLIEDYWQVIQDNVSIAYEPYESGFNGGQLDPAEFIDDDVFYRTSWTYGFQYWLGELLTDPTGTLAGLGGGIGRTRAVTLDSSTNLWLFVNDYWNQDNVGGVTVQLHRTSDALVPVPGTFLLVALGLSWLGLSKSFKQPF